MEIRDVGVKNVKGRQKEFNEDYHYAVNAKLFKDHDVYFLVIADGMGGHDDAKKASDYAIEKMESWWSDYKLQFENIDAFVTHLEGALKDAFKDINEDLIEEGINTNLKIGTTLSAMIIIDQTYFICHVGDGRVYLYNNDENNNEAKTIDLNTGLGLHQLTIDHTLLQRKLDQGEVTDANKADLIRSGVLTQCLGIKGEIEPSFTFGSVSKDYLFLLCTDGVYKYIGEKTLGNILAKNDQYTSQQLVDQIYEAVKLTEFKDDICALLIK